MRLLLLRRLNGRRVPESLTAPDETETAAPLKADRSHSGRTAIALVSAAGERGERAGWGGVGSGERDASSSGQWSSDRPQWPTGRPLPAAQSDALFMPTAKGAPATHMVSAHCAVIICPLTVLLVLQSATEASTDSCIRSD